jgi:hypothetical protein
MVTGMVSRVGEVQNRKTSEAGEQRLKVLQIYLQTTMNVNAYGLETDPEV